MSYYQVLGITADADGEAVRRAYLAQARQHHPDAGGDAAAMTALNEAWEVLSDPVRRRRYDLEVGLQPGPTTPSSASADLLVDPDLFDDRPVSTAAVPGLLPLVPPAIFAAAITVGCIALVLDAPAMLGVAVLLFLVSCVAVAAVALLTLRGSVRR